MQAKLKTKTYDLIDNGVRQSNQADGANVLGLLFTNVEDMDELEQEATNCSKITILDGDRVDSVYEDYTNFRSITKENDIVDIVVQQDNYVKQISTLKNTVASQASTIATQAAQIESIESSQAAQDTDISDITDAVLEISEIVYGGDE